MHWIRGRACLGGVCAALVLSGCFLRPVKKARVVVHEVAKPDAITGARATVAALTRLFAAEEVSARWFTTEFATETTPDEIAKTIATAKANLGDFRSVTNEGDHFVVLFDRGSLNAFARLTENDRFAVLVIKPSLSVPRSMEQALLPFHELGGSVSAIVITNGVERAALNPDLALSSSSSSHLPILAALRDHVEANAQTWRDIIDVKAAEPTFSHPFLSGWPDAPFTLFSLTALMMAKNDDVAADAILTVIGRGAPEAYAPKNKPFLFAREIFKLTAPENAALLVRFRSGDEAAKRDVLKELEAAPKSSATSDPFRLPPHDVGYFFTTRELCSLMKRVHDLPFVSIDPGLADRKDWDAIAYQGGSDHGAVSMTTWVEKAGKSHCVSATWNAPALIEESRFLRTYVGILAFLHAN